MSGKMIFFKRLIFSALIVFTLASCENDESEKDYLVTFEDVQLSESGYYNGSDLKGVPSTYELYGQEVTEYLGGFNSGNVNFINIFNSTWNSWSGIACSNQVNMDSIGYGNQYSVYSKSGANDSKKFAVINSDNAMLNFNEEVSIQSLMINNSTYTYHAVKDGNDGSGFARKFAENDYFVVKVTGYDSTNVETASIEVYLADYRNGLSYICKDWTLVDLKSLGGVKKISFSFISTDANDWGIKTPAYCCIDNIRYKK